MQNDHLKNLPATALMNFEFCLQLSWQSQTTYKARKPDIPNSVLK